MPCPAGLRMMRRAMSAGGTATVGTTGDLIVPFNANRVAITFSWIAASGFSLRLGTTSGAQMILTGLTASGPVTFAVDQHGNLPQGPFFAQSIVNTALIAWAETVLPPSESN